ncbi:MAG: ribonuclease P protein component [Paramuribaculum sp.]|nr:ribonuclease P protein component [Paramuribaculum sp.]
MVPKRRLRHAVDRVTMRRRMREAYRLNRHLLPPEAACLDIVFIYVAPQLTSYRNTHGSLVKLLGRVAESLVSASENR